MKPRILYKSYSAEYLEDMRQVKESHHGGACIQDISQDKSMFLWFPFPKMSERKEPCCVRQKEGNDDHRINNIPPF